ncbi:hypothetical protein YC2023_004951 [Brassica napus]
MNCELSISEINLKTRKNFVNLGDYKIIFFTRKEVETFNHGGFLLTGRNHGLSRHDTVSIYLGMDDNNCRNSPIISMSTKISLLDQFLSSGRASIGNDDDDRWQVVMIQLVGFLVISIQLGSKNSSIQIVSRNIKILPETSQLKVVMSASAEVLQMYLAWRQQVAGCFSGNDDDEDRWQVVMVKLVWFVVVSMRYTKDGMMLLTYTTLLCKFRKINAI